VGRPTSTVTTSSLEKTGGEARLISPELASIGARASASCGAAREHALSSAGDDAGSRVTADTGM
jgi:hypothetical protein